MTSSARSSRTPSWLIAVASAIAISFLGVFFLYPVGALIKRGLMPEGHLALDALWRSWTSSGTGNVVWFTAWSAGVATAAAVLLGLPVAYVLYRLSFPGRNLLRAIVTLPFVLPSVVVGLAFTELFGTGWLSGLSLSGTGLGIVIALVYFNVGVVVRTVGRFWRDLDPRLAEAASALGASPTRVWLTITLPALLPAIAAAASVVFLFCATAFGVVLMLGGLRYSNLETEIYYLTTQQFDLTAATALSVLQLLAIVILLVVVGRIQPRETARAPYLPRRPRSQDAPALLITLAVAIASLAPIASLALGAVRRNGHWSLDYFKALAGIGGDPNRGSPLLVSPVDALGNSLRNAAAATVIALVMGMIVAFVVTRPSRPQRGRVPARILDGVFMLPLGVSAVTVGFGFLITLNHGFLDLRDSMWMIPIAQALVALPLVVRTVVPVWRSLDDRQRQAASALGAGPLRVLWSVDVGAIRRVLPTAAGFALAVSMGEFGATSFLARDDAPTLPVVIYKLLGRPGTDNFGMGMAAATILVLISAGLMMGLERWAERKPHV